MLVGGANKQTKCNNILAFALLQLPTFKHGDVIVNESYAACFYLEVPTQHIVLFFFFLLFF